MNEDEHLQMTHDEPRSTVNWTAVYLAVAITAVATILGLWAFSLIYTP